MSSINWIGTVGRIERRAAPSVLFGKDFFESKGAETSSMLLLGSSYVFLLLFLPLATPSFAQDAVVDVKNDQAVVESVEPEAEPEQLQFDLPDPNSATAKRTAIELPQTPSLRRDSEEATELQTANVEGTLETAAAEQDIDSSVGLPTEEQLKDELKSVEEDESLEDEQRERLTSLINQALQWLHDAKSFRAKAEKTSTKTKAVPARVEKLKQVLRETSDDSELPELEQRSIAEIEGKLQELQDELNANRSRIDAEASRVADLQQTRRESQNLIQQISDKRDEVNEQLSASPGANLDPLQHRLQTIERKTHLSFLDAREELIKAETKYSRAMVSTLPLQNDLDVRTISRVESLLEHFRDALQRKKQEELLREIEEAKEKAKSADPDLHALADHNLQLAELLSKYNGLLSGAKDELDSITRKFSQQEKSFLSIQEKVEEIGMTAAIGVLLRSQDHELMDDHPLRVRASQIEDELPHVELSRITAKEEREEMAEIKMLIDQYTSRVAARLPEEEAREMVRELLEVRRDYLDNLESELFDYEETLGDLHIKLQKTADVTADHHRYIQEHVLWIRSSEPISSDDVTQAQLGLEQFFAPNAWKRVLSDLGAAIQNHLLVSLSCFAALVIGLVLVDRLKDRIADVGQLKSVQADYRFAPTAEVAFETILLASVCPIVCLFVSWWILNSHQFGELTMSLGVGLKWTSTTWLALSLLQQVVRPGGLAECHFRWHENNLAVIRKNLRLLLALGLPAVFFVMVIESFQDGVWTSSLGRLSFVAGMFIMALFMHRLLTPYRASSGIWANRDVWLFKVRHVVHAALVFAPLCLAVLAAIGYSYSAHQLAYRGHLSLWLAIGVVLLHAMISRYFRIARRNAAVRHMQRKRAEAEESDNEIPTEDELDFRVIGDQLQRLLRGTAAVACLLGMSLIWADMVPALSYLNDRQLWTSTQMVTENVANENGSVQLRTYQKIVPITLADLVLCIITACATVMAARNIPGLLNVTILERLPIDYGTRYAMTAVSRYMISLIGIVAAFNFIGVTWNSIQWLVAAMTVGLGFGLQEIFANFVSGLIILVERPIRVGDTVTVGGVMGKVTRVQIRATTITDFDRRELVVPNRRFITEDVINWTLSDPITRLVLPVGIAYSCDPQMARERLLAVAAKHPLVVKDPEPTAIFMGFGDSTLDLELRVFIVGRDQAFEVRDQLNLAINESFKEASLEIAFPQCDLHIRSIESSVPIDTMGLDVAASSGVAKLERQTSDRSEKAA